MKNLRFRFIMSAICLTSITAGAINSKAAPVQFNQVLQIINAKPGKANTSNFAQLRLTETNLTFASDDDTGKKSAPQDDRVITETRAEIVEDDVCDCELPVVVNRRFPYGWLALGAVPLLFLIPRGKDKPTPTPTIPTETPTPPGMTPTPTPPDTTPTPPGMTPTPTPPDMTPTPPPPGMTPTPPTTPTPSVTPTPPDTTPTPPMVTPTPPEPVPEPMTILLFGTGLASIGIAARKKFGKKDDENTEE